MTVSKLTNNVKPLDEVDKINEIIDELDNIDPLPSQTGQSGKYLTTNGTVPSWADVQSLPSQTGKAGKFLQTDGTDASWESAPFRNIGEIVASTIPLTDAGLHLLDGALINGSGIYSDFVTYIAGLVSDYPDLFETEANWQTAVTTYGVCGKFVYDATANTVRLPKVTGKIDGTTDVNALGDLAPLMVKLPNITGTFYLTGGSGGYGSQTGAFYLAQQSSGYQHGPDGSSANPTTGFDASRCSSVYSGNGTDTTIHEQAINVLLYIVIATSTKTDIEVDIDAIATDVNGKMDRDGLNALASVCVESYQDGTSWYRVYSDGWCEQGGYFPTASSYGMQTVTFLKPYKDTNYNVLTTVGGYNSSNNVQFLHIGTFNKTASSFQTRNDNAFDKTWQASGYIR